jgi:hypothetical protein
MSASFSAKAVTVVTSGYVCLALLGMKFGPRWLQKLLVKSLTVSRDSRTPRYNSTRN